MFLNKIKDKYYDNLLSSYVESGEINEIKNILEKKFLLNNSSDLKILNNYLIKFLSEQKFEKLFNKNLIWVNSFESKSCTYINNFLINIFKENNIVFDKPTKFVDELYDLIKIRNINKIDFEDLCNFSYSYQYLLSEKYKDLKILNSSASFFETSNKLYFTHYFLTKCFIYIVKNPYEIFKRNKMYYSSDKKINYMEGLTAGDNNDVYHKYDDNNYFVSENKQSWSTNVSSWTNPNVISTFRGIIIKEEELIEDPLQKLSELVSHLIQSGINCKLDYSYLQNYIEENPIEKEIIPMADLSKKELKILNRDIGNVADKLNYKPSL
tara:strand:+ start:1283 stop:2254 length:972 start_codon:yes stop_codon:yes gene_type:complete